MLFSWPELINVPKHSDDRYVVFRISTNKYLAPNNKSRTGKATKFSSLKTQKPSL